MVEAARLDGSFTERRARPDPRTAGPAFRSSAPGLAAELVARAERTATESVAWQGFTHAIKDALAPEERIGVLEMLWEVVYADGQLHDYEPRCCAALRACSMSATATAARPGCG